MLPFFNIQITNLETLHIIKGNVFYDLKINDFLGKYDIKCLILFVFQELEAVRDVLIPPLACAAAKLGDIDALRAIAEMVM